jgi:hypothetical protein
LSNGEAAVIANSKNSPSAIFAERSNPESSDEDWIASSQQLLAMTAEMSVV